LPEKGTDEPIHAPSWDDLKRSGAALFFVRGFFACIVGAIACTLFFLTAREDLGIAVLLGFEGLGLGLILAGVVEYRFYELNLDVQEIKRLLKEKGEEKS
jgi:hypothetical protein